MRKRIILAALTTTSALVVSVLAAPPSAQASTTPKAIPNTKPAWTGQAKHLGHAANAGKVQARVYLAPKGGIAALEHDALAVSTPGNASYGKFLTASQYSAAYSPTASTVSAVSSWLKSTGLKVKSVESHNRYIAIAGTVANAEHAFGSQIDTYRTDGVTAQAPATTLKAPSNLANSVLTVTGLDTRPSLVTPKHVVSDAPPAAGFHNARPCSTYWGQLTAKTQADGTTPLPKFNGKYLPYAPCGYTGPQFRSIYEGATTLDGTGVTVGITDAYASPTIKKDVKTYGTNHGDGGYAPGQYTQWKASKFTHQAECGPSGWYGEQTLDVEAIHAMAPAANIRYYGSASCEDSDFLDTLGQVVDEDAVQVVSNSWGDAGEVADSDTIAAYTQVFTQAAMEGISVLFSSGDSGDELANTGIKQADDPATNPYVTAVGGTATAIGYQGQLLYTTGWGTDKYSLSADQKSWSPLGFLYGAGGGNSAVWNQPSYQAGVTSGPYRQVPDVGLNADPNTGMLIGITQTFPDGVHYDEYRIGGTSLASPLFAGLTALALQKAGGGGKGLLNPTIYANATSGAFTDVKGKPDDAGVVRPDYVNGVDGSKGIIYSVRTLDQDSSLTTVKGYDNVTGVGAPNPKYLNVFSS
jgi:subtilase family serine protease